MIKFQTKIIKKTGQVSKIKSYNLSCNYIRIPIMDFSRCKAKISLSYSASVITHFNFFSYCTSRKTK